MLYIRITLCLFFFFFSSPLQVHFLNIEIEIEIEIRDRDTRPFGEKKKQKTKSTSSREGAVVSLTPSHPTCTNHIRPASAPRQRASEGGWKFQIHGTSFDRRAKYGRVTWFLEPVIE
jgi:hypothetical protein